jgi:hypothetical protein
MVDSRCVIFPEGELLFEPAPNGGKIAWRMVIQVINSSDYQPAIDENEPFVEKTSNASSGNNDLRCGRIKALVVNMKGSPSGDVANVSVATNAWVSSV